MASLVNLLAGAYLINDFESIYNYKIARRDSPLGKTHGIVLSYRFGEGYNAGG